MAVQGTLQNCPIRCRRRGASHHDDIEAGQALAPQSKVLPDEALEAISVDGLANGLAGDREAEATGSVTIRCGQQRQVSIRGSGRRRREDSTEIPGSQQSSASREAA